MFDLIFENVSVKEPKDSKKRPHPDSENEGEADEPTTSAATGVSVDNLDSLPKLPDGKIDTSKLSKNQRRKLAKKLKADDGKAVPTGGEAKENASEKKETKDSEVKENAGKKEKKEKENKGSSKDMVTLPSGVKILDKKVGDGAEVSVG
jgi:FKBP-type peptidyl-prolyl cis-trans isomerase